MLDIITSAATEPIELAEFANYVLENVDFNDQHSIRSCSEQLGRLYLNRTVLTDYVLAGLKSGLGTFESQNRYTPPSLIMARGPDFIVRANLWRATDTYEKLDLNVYGLAHDHNFDFLTLNYSGPGYRSEMYTYDYSAVAGQIGEQVELVGNGTLQLSPGEMFLYRKSVDIHIQYPPIEDSVTINLMATLDNADYPNQYIFDMSKNTIADILGGFHRQEHVFAMALAVNDDECNEVMLRIMQKTDCPLTRTYLRNGLAGLEQRLLA
jgi:hypothetical protein